MRDGYIETRNGRIWYSVYGEGTRGTPLLVLHGGPGFLSMPEVVSELSDTRPVYFYDQLGCGRSGRATDRSFYSVEHYVDELAQIREFLKLGEVYLMGFSWGTMLACSYMLEKKPEGVKGLILCGPYLSSPRWHDDQRAYIEQMPPDMKSAIKDAERAGDYGKRYQDAVMSYYHRHVCRLDPWPEYLQEALSELNMDVYLTMWGPSEFTINGALKDRDLMGRLNEIKAPVLLVSGEHDEAAAGTVAEYREAFPDSDMIVIPDASHLHHLEKPELFLKTVRDFLERTGR
ncbi:MAG: proline iminopeptidase-family hydrolase [Candidatus Omnitrophica bacterium]|nr:proline iminopeptidase-family hydrolase [Candidatus Omnitrophota bacterium]MDD5488495.1 proline iminopeptidase-family hydrolase [Candidatus Omnitrophota bacterium]